MKNYLVVGGTRGIGKKISEELSLKGFNVIATGRNIENSTLPNVHYIQWDAKEALHLNAEMQSLDGIVYAPGTISLKPFHRISREEFQSEMEVNVYGAIEVLQKCLPLLKKSEKPSVVLFSTVAVSQGMPFHSSIAAAKGAIEGLVKSLAAEWAPTIRVNAIAPSLTATDLAEKLISTPEKLDASNKRHPLQRIGTVEDIASAALFLLSEKSAWITGQVLHVDGGMSKIRSL
ncbi:MAG: SDR family oxidoreductase [Flavobacteriales bacterium]